MEALAVQLELGLAVEHEVELLLTASALVVLLDERLVSAYRYEHVRAEGGQAEEMLERVDRRGFRP